MPEEFQMHYSKNHPFLASIKERYNLTKSGSKKITQHIVLDLKGSELQYEVGDSIGIFPVNDPQLVDKTLHAMKASGKEKIVEKHSEETMLLRDFLEKKANITDVSRKLLMDICHRQTHPEKKAKIESFFAEGHKEELKAYLDTHELWDILLENSEAHFEIQELCNSLMPLLPRLYSIASSSDVVGEEIHLTVALLKYETHGHLRKGVCTHYLCDLVPLHQPIVPVYIQPHHGFTLPSDSSVSIIMIGPGTGVAPFRAFMQKRIWQKATGRNWLFFGEWNRIHDFFYEDFWTQYETQGKLKLNVAFSRDQDYKIYVQHRMREEGAELYNWIREGAYVFVCGDAQRMAKDVETTLHTIVQEHGKMTEQEAKAFIKQLRTEKRYLRDVY
jgi:sulfite reductase (NADPH) flavoprotein alpha-component